MVQRHEQAAAINCMVRAGNLIQSRACLDGSGRMVAGITLYDEIVA
jgi:hypothetical protein